MTSFNFATKFLVSKTHFFVHLQRIIEGNNNYILRTHRDHWTTVLIVFAFTKTVSFLLTNLGAIHFPSSDYSLILYIVIFENKSIVA